MNISLINNSQVMNFGQSANRSKYKNHLYSNSAALAAATLLLFSAAGCSDDTFQKEHSNVGNYLELHNVKAESTDVSKLSPLEQKMLKSAQKLAGDYYSVGYDKKNKMLVLQALDICKNKFNYDVDAFKYTMSTLKDSFGLKDGVLRKYNPELNADLKLLYSEMRDFYEVHPEKISLDGYPIDIIKFAHDAGKPFVSTKPDIGNLNDAILMPGCSLNIPLNEIGKDLRFLQFSSQFNVFRDVSK